MKKGFIDGLLDSLDCTLSSTFQNRSFKERLIKKKAPTHR